MIEVSKDSHGKRQYNNGEFPFYITVLSDTNDAFSFSTGGSKISQ